MLVRRTGHRSASDAWQLALAGVADQRDQADPSGVQPAQGQLRVRPHALRPFHYDDIMSKTRQISITLPEELIERIKEAVERGEARSVSSYIASRLKPGMIMDALFAEWDADRGAPPADVNAWAESELDRAFAEQASLRHGHGSVGAA